MALDDIFKAISLGTSLARRAMELKQQVDSLRTAPAIDYTRTADVGTLDRRIADLEFVARNQAARINSLESSLEIASTLTESLARRMSTIFWIALSSGIVTTAALALSIAALIYTR
jgi:predicted RNase H-like nuclease (RuvC/YqgF family)